MKLETLKDLYSVEMKLVKALPKMTEAAANPDLSAGFSEHLEQTRAHAARLETILKSHGQTTRGPKCKTKDGLIEEGAEMIEEESGNEVRDAGLICAALRVEHYEIASSGCVFTFADIPGNSKGAKLFSKTLEKEGDTDKKLTKLAVSTINLEANQ